jgi:hypothetical protein
MPAAFILSFAQLWDPVIRRILLRALLLTLLLFAGLAWAVFKGIAMIETNGWPGWLQSFWTNGAGDAAAFLLSMLLTWLGFTSIGTASIYRFVRPVCYQGFPDAALPEALQAKNRRQSWRLIDGQLTQDDA